MMEQEFRWPLRVYIEDTDAGGIVYYVNYLKFMERARTEFLRSLGYGREFIFTSDLMFVVHSINSEYVKPARLDDELFATVRVIAAGKTFLTMEQNICLQQDGELLCRGVVKIACVDRETVKPRRIPPEIVRRLAVDGQEGGQE